MARGLSKGLSIIFSLLMMVFVSGVKADSVNIIVGAEISENAPVCNGIGLKFDTSQTITFGSTNAHIVSFDISPSQGMWAATVSKNNDTVLELAIGSLSPIALLTETVYPAGTVIELNGPVRWSGTSVFALVGQNTVGGCTARCFRLLTFASTGTLSSTVDFSTNLGIGVQNFVTNGTDLWTMNQNAAQTADRPFHLTTAGVSTSAAGSNTSGEFVENAVDLNGSTSVIWTSTALFPSFYEVWNQATPPAFQSSHSTSCAGVQLTGIHVASAINSLFTSCDGRVNVANLTTFVEQTTQNSATIGGVSTDNALVYDATFNRLFYGVRGIGQSNMTELDSSTLAIISNVNTSIANSTGAGVIDNQTSIDTTHGNLYQVGNVASGSAKGFYIARWNYCQLQ